MNIIRLVTGEYLVNTYIAACPESRNAVIIDPGGDAEDILAAVTGNNLQVRYILNTHGHEDHTAANRELKQSLSVPVCLHEEDFTFFDSHSHCANRQLKDGDILKVGTLDIRVIHSPGHTPGSCCFYTHGSLFSGDTLFVGDVGRTDLAGGSLPVLLRSLEVKILILPPETVVHPGHDYAETPTSTLAWEMKENPYITDFILAEK